MKKVTLGMALLVVAAACQSMAWGEGYRRLLQGREIKALLKDGALIRSVPCVPGQPFLQEEIIAKNGDYTGLQDRADTTGRASVNNDQLCVVVREHRQCRRLLRDAQGRYWQEQRFEPDVPVVSRQVEFLPLNTPLNCVEKE